MNLKKQPAFRFIQVDNLEELNLENVGVHFTRTQSYIHNGGGSNGCTVAKKYTVKIAINAFEDWGKTKYSILEDATLESNTNFPKEQELVLAPNQKLDALIQVFDKTGKFHFFGFRGQKFEINTGTRMDKWVEKYI